MGHQDDKKLNTIDVSNAVYQVNRNIMQGNNGAGGIQPLSGYMMNQNIHHRVGARH